MGAGPHRNISSVKGYSLTYYKDQKGHVMFVQYTYPSAIGAITIGATSSALTHLLFETDRPLDTAQQETPLIKEAFGQLTEYLQGQRQLFDLPLEPKGTPFQQSVWQALLSIPYAETRSYKQIADQIGNSKSMRAVGIAYHNNPIAIIIPCHRVIGASGKLVGYAGGLNLKARLLKLEQEGVL